MVEGLRGQGESSWGKPEPIGTSSAAGAEVHGYRYNGIAFLQFKAGKGEASKLADAVQDLPGVVSRKLVATNRVGSGIDEFGCLFMIEFGGDSETDFKNSKKALLGVRPATSTTLYAVVNDYDAKDPTEFTPLL